MITLFFVISLIALVILIVFAFRKESEGLGYVAVFVGVTVLILGGSDAILWCNVSTGHIIAEKIAMYEEENEEIESSIENSIEDSVYSMKAKATAKFEKRAKGKKHKEKSKHEHELEYYGEW